jgi:hypothetical protein
MPVYQTARVGVNQAASEAIRKAAVSRAGTLTPVGATAYLAAAPSARFLHAIVGLPGIMRMGAPTLGVESQGPEEFS